MDQRIKVWIPDQQELDYLWERVKRSKIFSDSRNSDRETFFYAMTHSLLLKCDSAYLRVTRVIENESCEIHGFVLDAPVSRYAEEMKKALRFLFDEYNLRRIECRIPVDLKSVRRFLADKIGFTKEGELRAAYVRGGTAKPMHLFSILREEI